jgi:3-methyladenine DNA glycosylase AlkD
MMRSEWLDQLGDAFSEAANPVRAVSMSAYMRNNFSFFGIMAGPRKEILSHFFQRANLPGTNDWRPLVKEMWKLPEREWQYAAQELCLKMKRDWKPEDGALFTHMISTRSWWDTVDFIAPNLSGNLFRKYPEILEPTLDLWVQSDQHWLWRSALIFQLKYRALTDQQRLFDLCGRFSGENDFFIRKAIGWALRQYAEVEPQAVREFVEEQPLSPLSRKEALRKL